jgi:signal transduction histidine kinase
MIATSQPRARIGPSVASVGAFLVGVTAALYGWSLGALPGIASSWIVDVGLVAFPLLASASFIEAAGRRAAGTSRSWWLLSAALALAGGGGFVLALERHAAPPAEAYKLAADAFFAPATALALVGVATSPFTAPGAVARLRRVLDGGIIALGLFLALWAVVGRDPDFAMARPASLVPVLLPMIDAVIGTFVLYMLTGTTGDRRPVVIFGAGLAALTAANSGFAAADATSQPIAGWVYAAWAGGFALTTIGAASTGSVTARDYGKTVVLRRLPHVVAASAAIVVYITYLSGRRLDSVLVTGALLMFLLALGREWVLAAENDRLASARQSERLAARRDQERAAQAQRENEVKTKFLAAMSHELRTPLNSILGFAQLGQAAGLDLDPRTRRYLENIEASGRHLLALITDVLDLSKVAAGELTLDIGVVDCGPIVRDCMAQMAPIASAANVTLRQPEGGYTVAADPRRLRQIVLNLLSNAIKFTPPQGHVRVQLEACENTVAVKVFDTGVGVAPEDQERIFQEFTQVHAGRVKEYSGTGLGLPLSRHLARLMGGDVTVASTVGEGSVFTLLVPAVGALALTHRAIDGATS